MARTNRVTRKFEVSVTPCSSHEKHLSYSTVVSTETRSEAIERAIEKMYGARCFWFPDSGLPGYGQVFEALQPTRNNSNPGNSAVTYRASLEVRPLAKKSPTFLKQEVEDRQADAEAQAWEDDLRAARNLGETAAYNGLPCPTDADPNRADEMKRGYRDGMDNINEDAERRQSEADEERRENEQYQREYEAAECKRTEERNARHERNKQRLAAEVERIRAIDLSQPITDEILHAVVNSIAVVSFKHGMALGEWKRRMQAGEFPDVVRQYVQSDWIFTRLENVVPHEWEFGDDVPE